MTDRKTRGVTLYYQVKEYLKEKIASNEWPVGKKLPAEPELAAQLNVSRATVRQALHELAEEGVLVRKQGTGTFVAEFSYEGNFTDRYFPVELGKRHALISFSIVPAEKPIAKHLAIPENSLVYSIYRTRFLKDGNVPAVIEKSYVLAEHYKDLKAEDLIGDVKVYDLLVERYGVVLASSITEIQATLLNQQEAAILGCKRDVPVLLMTRTCYNLAGSPVVLTRSLFRPDKCKLVIHNEMI